MLGKHTSKGDLAQALSFINVIFFLQIPMIFPESFSVLIFKRCLFS